MIEALDGPSKPFVVTINNSTPVEVKSSTEPLEERKVITMQGNGKFYVYFADDGETPSNSDVSTKGFIQYKNSKESYEAASSQTVFILSVTGSVTVRIAERA
jgi:hypothetical protein